MTTQNLIVSIITLLVSSAWTPLLRKIPDANLVLIVIRAILAGVPTEPTVQKLQAKLAKKEDASEKPIEGPIPPAPPTAA